MIFLIIIIPVILFSLFLLRGIIVEGKCSNCKSFKIKKVERKNSFDEFSSYECNDCKSEFILPTSSSHDIKYSLFTSLYFKFIILPKIKLLHEVFNHKKREMIKILIDKYGSIEKIPEFRKEFLGISQKDIEYYKISNL